MFRVYDIVSMSVQRSLDGCLAPDFIKEKEVSEKEVKYSDLIFGVRVCQIYIYYHLFSFLLKIWEHKYE